MTLDALRTRCCIAGGGPAGLMLGLLLARAGVEVIVLEKHADFLRDFRGDTIHPSPMEVMHELGWLEEFLQLPHQPVPRLTAQFGDTVVALADFSRLRARAKFIAMMPQWDFLAFLARKAQASPSFRLIMQAEAHELLREGDRVIGLQARLPAGAVEIRADLVVAAEGRGSTLRAKSGLIVEEFGAPMDVLWFRLSRQSGDTSETQGRFDPGRIFIMLNRGAYWQCAYVIAKGADAQMRAAGLPTFRASLAAMLPFDRRRVAEIQDWDAVKLLTVQVNRLQQWWRPGFLCIGDAAHAMSPVGGVGVNLAVQDAVAAANILADPLARGIVGPSDLQRVQRRRARPTRLTQRLQLMIQTRVIAPALSQRGPIKPPLMLRLLTRVPVLRDLPGRIIGLGFRPELPRSPAK